MINYDMYNISYFHIEYMRVVTILTNINYKS